MGKTYNELRSQNYRFASDQNAILIAGETIILTSETTPAIKILSNFILLQRRFFFFFRTTVLLGGSSVKKLTELYDLTKLLCFGLCRYRLSTKSFPSLCESCNYDGLSDPRLAVMRLSRLLQFHGKIFKNICFKQAEIVLEQLTGNSKAAGSNPARGLVFRSACFK